MRQTAAVQVIMSVVLGLCVSLIRFAVRGEFENIYVDLNAFTLTNFAYLVVAAFVPVLLLIVWMRIRDSAPNRVYMWFIGTSAFLFFASQLALELILLMEGVALEQTFWHHLMLGASMGSFVLLAFLAEATRVRRESKKGPNDSLLAVG